MAAPDEHERALLEELRSNVSDILQTEEHRHDAFLMRWLRARDLDVTKAEEMLRASFKWREEWNVDKVLNRKLDPWYEHTYPTWMEGTDLGGRPVIEMPLGSWDIRKAMEGDKETDFIHHVNKWFESLSQKIRECNIGKSPNDFPITQCLIIVDWKGYSYAQLMHWRALQNTLKIAATYEMHYPEVLYKAFFINCPTIFPLFMTMLKHIIAPNTVKKITCSSNPSDWIPLLHSEINPKELGTLYGGTSRVLMIDDKEYIN